MPGPFKIYENVEIKLHHLQRFVSQAMELRFLRARLNIINKDITISTSRYVYLKNKCINFTLVLEILIPFFKYEPLKLINER